MVHDSVGNYTLPLNHSVLVRSVRCQLGCHGETCEHMWSSLIGLQSAARLGTRQTGEPRGNLGTL